MAPSALSTTWHICWQAAMGRNLLADPLLIRRIRGRLLQAHGRHGRTLLDYLLTPTEMHVVSMLPPGDSPGAMDREVASIVSRWVRETQGTRGPVFVDRYRAHRIETVSELRAEIRMLAWRPVTAGLCRRPTYYVHAAVRIALGLALSDGFDSRALLGLFGGTVPQARRTLHAFIVRRPSAEESVAWELAHGLCLAVGCLGPKSRMAREVKACTAALVAAAHPHGIDGALRLLEAWVACKLAQPETDPAAGPRARALVAGLAVKLELCPAASVARYFGRARATLCEQMADSRRRPLDQQILSTPLPRVVEEAVALSLK